MTSSSTFFIFKFFILFYLFIHFCSVFVCVYTLKINKKFEILRVEIIILAGFVGW